jgi:membrane-associated phospholipid phosphatase
MHYPSDVAVGVVLGTALGLAVPLPRRREEPLPPKEPAANGSAPAAPVPNPEAIP